ASPTLADLLKSSTRAFGIGAVLAIPVFDGGRREATVAQGQAEAALALAQHRERVLTAFKEVEDQLVALQVLAAQGEQLGQASALSQQAAGTASSLWRNGLSSHLEVLDAQRSAWRHEGAALQAQAARQQATVGLIRALGGGWGEVPAPPAPRPVSQPLAQAPGS
ncbi:MAG: RND transporter, partial [Burkholderiales bacterium PBB5]